MDLHWTVYLLINPMCVKQDGAEGFRKSVLMFMDFMLGEPDKEYMIILYDVVNMLLKLRNTRTNKDSQIEVANRVLMIIPVVK